MTAPIPNPLLDHALAAYRVGLSVLPPCEDGSKRPLGKWKQYQQDRADEEQIRRWYRNGRCGFGMVTGAISGNVELFEFDDRLIYNDFRELAIDHNLGPLVERIEAGYLEETPGDGVHWLWHCAEIAGNTKLACRPKTLAELAAGSDKGPVKTLIETRGEGGFVVLAPSAGKVHPTGKPYRLLGGGLTTIATISPEERTHLFALARRFHCEEVKIPHLASPEKITDSYRPGDRFNQETDWPGLLESFGWVKAQEREGVSYWRRPGKEEGWSATTGYGGDGFFCFSSSTAFETNRSYDRFGAWAVLEHGGDFSAATKAAAIRFGMTRQRGVRRNTLPLSTDAEDCADDAMLIEQALSQAAEDSGALFEAEVLAALRRLRQADPAGWQRLRSRAKQANRQIALRDLDQLTEPKPAQRRPKDRDLDQSAALVGVRAGIYAVINGCLHHDRETMAGTVAVALTNFDARIIQCILHDDGLEESGRFLIEGKHCSGRPLKPLDIPMSRFASLTWVSANWGHSASVYAGQATRDHVRCAIELLSRIDRDEIPTRTIYGHLGWRRFKDDWCYLHGGGAIGSEGNQADIEVNFGAGHLSRYRLPDPPDGEALAAVVRVSLRLLEVAGPEIGWSLLAAIYRAPLGEALLIDLSVFVVGKTGTRKSELTALAQAHFGEFDARSFPANWQDSPNRLEKIAHHIKDGLLVCDDYKPGGDARANNRLSDTAERLLHHAVGNRSGRARLNSDLSERPTYFPRCLVLSSGEDLPGATSSSLRARLWTLKLNSGQVKLSVLSELQAARPQLAQSMAGFLRWLASQIDILKIDLPRQFEQLRDRQAQAQQGHGRHASNLASLRIGAGMLLKFAEVVGAISTDERRRLADQAQTVLNALALQQNNYLKDADEVSRFLSLLSAVLVSDRAHICDLYGGGMPLQGARWGWRSQVAQSWNPQSEEFEPRPTWSPRGPRIGWIDTETHLLYLEPEATYAGIQHLSREQGALFSLSSRALWERLKDAGILAKWDAKRQRHTTRVTVDGQNRALIVIDSSRLEPLPEVTDGTDGTDFEEIHKPSFSAELSTGVNPPQSPMTAPLGDSVGVDPLRGGGGSTTVQTVQNAENISTNSGLVLDGQNTSSAKTSNFGRSSDRWNVAEPPDPGGEDGASVWRLDGHLSEMAGLVHENAQPSNANSLDDQEEMVVLDGLDGQKHPLGGYGSLHHASSDASALANLLRYYRGAERATLLAGKLGWNTKRLMFAAMELKEHGLVEMNSEMIKPVREGC